MSIHILPASPSPSPSYPLPFATTKTTTLHTTLTATINAVLHLSIPTPTTPPLTPYTTAPFPTSAGAKAYPYGLPVLVLTQLDAVVFDPVGNRVVSTVTTVERAPGETGLGLGGIPGGGGDGGGGDRGGYGMDGDGWKDWTGRERAGVLAAGVLVVVGMVGMGVWWGCRRGAWGRRGREGKGKGKGMKMKDMGDDKRGGKRKRSCKKRTRFDVVDKDVERASWEEMPMKELSRTTGESVRTAVTPAATVGAVLGKGIRGMGGRSGGPADSAHQMSGEMPSPDCFDQGQYQASVQASVPAHQGSRERLADPPASNEGSGRVSAYRAMRMQERREERARPYVLDVAQRLSQL